MKIILIVIPWAPRLERYDSWVPRGRMVRSTILAGDDDVQRVTMILLSLLLLKELSGFFFWPFHHPLMACLWLDLLTISLSYSRTPAYYDLRFSTGRFVWPVHRFRSDLTASRYRTGSMFDRLSLGCFGSNMTVPWRFRVAIIGHG